MIGPVQFRPPDGAALDPLRQYRYLTRRQLRTGWHLDVAIMPQCVDELARLRISRRDHLEQAIAVEERDVAVFQLLVVTGEAAFGQDRRNARVEEALVGVWRIRRCKHGEAAEEAK